MKKNNLSNFIILTLIITIIILIAIGSYYKISLKRGIYKDTIIVNQLGEIRGNIQRFTKLKIIKDKKSYIVKKDIDTIFNNLNNLFKEKNIIPSNSDKEKFFFKFYSLKKLWDKLKTNNNNLINLSEKAWQKSNELIKEYEYIHQKKFLSILKNMDIFIYLSILFLTIITLMVYFKIKKGLEIDLIHDKLTGIYNRLFFDEQYSYLINKSKKDNIPLSLIIIDIDNFKIINDTYGHKKGDLILKEVSNTIKNSIRRMDLPFRYGGEEFAVLLPNTVLEEAVIVAKRINENIPQQIKLENNKPVTISGGVGEYKIDEHPKEFFKRVDEALYEAKKSGKNKIIKA